MPTARGKVQQQLWLVGLPGSRYSCGFVLSATRCAPDQIEGLVVVQDTIPEK